MFNGLFVAPSELVQLNPNPHSGRFVVGIGSIFGIHSLRHYLNSHASSLDFSMLALLSVHRGGRGRKRSWKGGRSRF